MESLLKTQDLFGRVVVLKGRRDTLAPLMLSLSVKLQNMSRVALIDSMNCFDPYFIQRYNYRNARNILNNILVARPFTAHQLRSLVASLEGIMKPDLKSLIVTSINNLFFDENVDERELPFLVEKLMRRLFVSTRDNGLITFLGLENIKKPRAYLINSIVKRHSDYCYEI